MTEFALDARLDADTYSVTDLSLSRVLLMNDARFPWVILVPRRSNCAEWLDFSSDDQQALLQEQLRVMAVLQELTGAHKLNVANLGNMVRQFHLHIIARFETDVAWPGPVWGQGVSEAYSDAEANALVSALQQALR
jgi:diadenosine tetraphosphate (Ap4A) HIT family hydrolase